MLQRLEKIPTLNSGELIDFQRALTTSKPLIVRGAASSWPAFTAWRNDAYLTAQAGNYPISLMQAPDPIFGIGCAERRTSLGYFLSVYREHPEIYVNGSDLPPTLSADLGKHPFLDAFAQLEDFDAEIGLFIASGGQFVQPHFDESENLYIVLDGSKEFLLAAPENYHDMCPIETQVLDESLFSGINAESTTSYLSLFEGVDWHHAVLAPGDLLYIPSYWWHMVNSDRRHLSLSLVRTDRRAQLRVFRMFLRLGIFPLTDKTAGRILGWIDHPEVALLKWKTLRVTRCPFEYYGLASAAIVAAWDEPSKRCSLEQEIEESASTWVLNELETRMDWSQSLTYMMQTFYRTETSRFTVNQPEELTTQ